MMCLGKENTKPSEVRSMSEEQKQQAEKISAEINKMTPEMREKALIFMQGMAAMVQPAKSEKKEQTA
jgi:hypothetical protein